MQLKLPAPMVALDQTMISRPKDMLKAFVMAADIGGLDDKQAAAGAGMDPSTWSQFKAGDRGIKPLVLNGYLDQCANELPLAYWAFTRGYSLCPLESEMEKRERVQRERAEKAEAENALLRGLLIGRTS